MKPRKVVNCIDRVKVVVDKFLFLSSVALRLRTNSFFDCACVYPKMGTYLMSCMT